MTGRLAIFLIAEATFGGMERRFARLAAHMTDTLLYTNTRALDTMEALGIRVPSGRVRLIAADLQTGPLRRRFERLISIPRIALQARIDGVEHVHIAMDPRAVTALYGSLSFLLPTYSVTVADSTLSFPNGLLQRTVEHAVFVDCLSGSIRSEAMARLPETKRNARFTVSPCSFTDLSKVKRSLTRDIDVVFMSRFAPGKGLSLLEAALGGLTGLEVHVCGSGPLTVSLPGASVYHASDPFAVLGRSKIFLSLQDKENYPSQSLLEAMASGCAVIATDVGETRRLLDERSAVLIPPDNPLALRSAILELIASPHRRAALGAQAREVVLREHSIERFADYLRCEVATTSNHRSKQPD